MIPCTFGKVPSISRETRSIVFRWNSTWLPFGVTTISTGSSCSVRIRVSSCTARIVGRRRERDLTERLVELFRVDAAGGLVGDLGNDREILGGNAAQVRVESLAVQVEARAFGLDRDHLIGGQRRDQVGEQPARNG